MIDWLRVRSPLSFVIVGRNERQDAQDLLAVIKGRIDSSSYGIFDATTGNPNVSLEYGYAEAIDLPRALYLSTHASDRFLQSSFRRANAGKKKRARALSLKIIHKLDGSTEVRRADVVQQLQADQARYPEGEIDDMVRRLHRAKLIRSQQGPHARVHIA